MWSSEEGWRDANLDGCGGGGGRQRGREMGSSTVESMGKGKRDHGIAVEGELKDRGCGRRQMGGETQSSTVVVVVVVGGFKRWGARWRDPWERG